MQTPYKARLLQATYFLSLWLSPMLPGLGRKKQAGTKTKKKRRVAKNSGGKTFKPSRITTKLVPQTRTTASAKAASRPERCVVIAASLLGNYKQFPAETVCKGRMAR